MRSTRPEQHPGGLIPAYIALGSNLGDSKEIFSCALIELQALTDCPLQVSSFWATTPVDCPPGSPDFLNAVACVQIPSDMDPEWLLRRLKDLEVRFGRRAKTLHNEARPLDLDIIAIGSMQCTTSELSVPHPRAHTRSFVLAPLAELAPGLVLPGQQASVSELLAGLAADPRMSIVVRAPAGGCAGDDPVRI